MNTGFNTLLIPYLGDCLRELYLIQEPYVFMGIQGSPEKSPFSLYGVPFDSTNSFRGGSRFAPLHIRIASQSLEAYSFRANFNLESNPPVDEGDIFVVHGSTETSLRNISLVAEESFRSRIPIFIGGDHTITYGIVEGALRAGIRPCLLIFDAHLDFRNDYLGYKFSHACVARRISERVGVENITVAGVRAADHSEIKEAKQLGLKYVSILEIMRGTSRDFIRRLRNALDGCRKIYISIDMDVIDPAYAPGVATPEPEGLTTSQLLNTLYNILDERIIGLDIVEVDPAVDKSDVTSFLAAKVLMESVSYLYSALRAKQK